MAESTVESLLDDFVEEVGRIWETKPFTKGYGSSGKPDRTWCIQGFTLGIECKDTNDDKCTALQTRELRDLRDKGGIPFVVNNDNVQIFLTLMEVYIQDNKEPVWLVEHPSYDLAFDVELYATETEEIDL